MQQGSSPQRRFDELTKKGGASNYNVLRFPDLSEVNKPKPPPERETPPYKLDQG